LKNNKATGLVGIPTELLMQYGMEKTSLQTGVKASSFQYQRKDTSVSVTTGEG